MKVLLLNDSDTKGGAARAAYRLHRGFRSTDASSQMLVRLKLSQDSAVVGPANNFSKALNFGRPVLDNLPLQLYRQRKADPFSSQWLLDRMASRVRSLAPDIINAHWICRGYMQIASLAKLPAPLVWTMHDMWPFTGGCHYSYGCERYQSACGACPQLGSARERDLSRWVWNRKHRAWRQLDLTLVSPSTWLAECARQSTLFRDLRIEVIPNGMDMQRYRPIEQRLAREWLNLPQDRRLALFGAAVGTQPRRKGFHLLEAALHHLSAAGWSEKLELLIFGPSTARDTIPSGFHTHYIGQLHDDVTLALLYSAADVTVVPSLQENLPQLVIESLACGTPVAAFAATGLPDAVAHEQDGYLAKPFDAEELAQGIAWIIEDQDRHRKLCMAARDRAEREFDHRLQASRYEALFAELLEKRQAQH